MFHHEMSKYIIFQLFHYMHLCEKQYLTGDYWGDVEDNRQENKKSFCSHDCHYYLKM